MSPTLTWRKSSFSEDTNCVEVAWRKSSFSDPDNCVEVACPVNGMAVRDSKNPDGPVLVFGRTEFTALLTAVTASGQR